MQQNYKVYRAHDTQLIESYVVSIFDGTGSMYHEYKSAIQAYFEVFSDVRKGMKEYQFQFQTDVYDLLPYQGTGGGNITKTFKTVFTSLLQNKQQLPKYLTIIFMSDGEEIFSIKELKSLIEEMKNNFSISFISLAVGKNFPYKISNNLRNEIHNQDPKIQSLFLVQRNRKRPQDQVKQLFRDVFQQIKQLIYFQDGYITVNQQVLQTIVSQPSERVIPGSVFLVKNQKTQVESKGKKMTPTEKEEDVIQLIQSSVQEGLIKSTPQNVQNIFKEIQSESSNIIDSTQLLQKFEKSDMNEKIQEILEFVDNVAEGNLPLNQLTDDQKTKIQEALISKQKSLKEEVLKYVQKVKNPKDLNQKTFQSRISEKYRQIKYGCFGEGEQQIQELSKLEQTEIVMKDTLSNLLQVLENDQQCDVIQLLEEFKNQTFISLDKVFKDCDFKVESQEQINVLKEMNNLFELIYKVRVKLAKVNEFVQVVKSRLEQKQTIEANINQSNAMFDSNEDFNYLPQELKLLVKEGIELEDAEKVFILIVDFNQSMVQESNIAAERFILNFQKVNEDKKLVIGWRDQLFYEYHQNLQTQEIQQGNISYQSLFQCLSSFEQKLKLKNRRISICLVSDGLTEYRSIHREFKVVKFHYSIQFIYLTVGRNLYSLIDAELQQKFSNKNVKGRPKLLNVARSLIVSNNLGQKLKEQFNQKYQQLLEEFEKQ